MSDLEYINVGGVDYTLRDNTARSNASSALTTANSASTTANSALTAANSKAPTSHSSTATTYGVGNASNYGHVKLSDTYTSNVGAAANAIGASQNALFSAYAKAYNNLQWQHISTHGGGATHNISIDLSIIKPGPPEMMAFKAGRIGLVQVGIVMNRTVPAESDIIIARNIDFIPIYPYSSSSVSATQACGWGVLWSYAANKSAVGVVEMDPDNNNETSRIHIWTGTDGPMNVGDSYFGSFWCITTA